jgi:PAT family beta-lactamase induction signal transducer AmpG
MKASGVTLADITLLAYVTLPIGLKVLWAPLLDRYALPFLGRRRGWLVVLQVALAAAVAALALTAPDDASAPRAAFVAVALGIAFLSASQDVVADAYRADVLAPSERAAGAAMFVNGYRVAILAATTGALWLSAVMPWRTVYLLLAGLMLATALVSLAAREPPDPGRTPTTLRHTLIEPWRDVARRLGPALWPVLAFVAVFGIPDEAGRRLTMPFLLDLGFSKGEIAFARQTLGLAFAVAGALLAGPVVARLGLRRGLLLLVVLQSVSNLGFCALDAVGRDVPALVAVVFVENGCQGMVGAGFVAFLMSLCHARWSAAQYALFTSVWFLVRTLLAGPVGLLAEHTGYAAAFALSAAAGIPALVLVARLPLRPDDEPPPVFAEAS